MSTMARSNQIDKRRCSELVTQNPPTMPAVILKKRDQPEVLRYLGFAGIFRQLAIQIKKKREVAKQWIYNRLF